MENEIWKPIIEYEGLYEVSSFGRVKRLARKTWNNNHNKDIIMSAKPDKKGYSRFKLTKINGDIRLIQIHRLVCGAFHPNPENKPCVNHIDGNPKNNHYTNLEWVTYSENALHAFHIIKTRTAPFRGVFGKNHFGSKIVIQLNKDYSFVNEWDSVADIDRHFGKTGVSGAMNDIKRKTRFGFVWMTKQVYQERLQALSV